MTTLGVLVAGAALWVARPDTRPTGVVARPAPTTSASAGLPMEPDAPTISVSALVTSPTPTARTGATTSPANRPAAKKPTRRTRTSPTPSRPTTTTAAPAPGKACSDPVFTTSNTNGGWSTKGYYVHNNVWNASEAGPETLYACSFRNWYAVSEQRNLSSNPGSVKAYPNVHKDYGSRKISSFSTITSRFASKGPGLGIYNFAYDIWINGVAESGSTEVMVWTENHKQVPSGDKVAKKTFGGVTYDVFVTGDEQYIAFRPTTVRRSGTVDLLAIFKWITSKGWLSDSATLGQICYGVEVVSTENRKATFTVTDFSIADA